MKTWTYKEVTATAEREILYWINRLHEDMRGFDKQHFHSMALGIFYLWAELTRDLEDNPARAKDSQRLEKIARTDVPE